MDEKNNKGTGRKLFAGIAVVMLLLLGGAYLYAENFLVDTPRPFVEWDIPTEPVARAAYDYAHALKLPAGAKQPVPFQFCKKPLGKYCLEKATPEEYHRHLCDTEAGEFVFRKVEGVKGMFLVRPYARISSQDARAQYSVEDPVFNVVVGGDMGAGYEDTYGQYFVQPPTGFLETFDAYIVRSGQSKLIRFFRNGSIDPMGKKSMRLPGNREIKWILDARSIEKSDAPTALVFRGIRRARDREFGIAGSEAILQSRIDGEAIALKREFAFRRPNGDRGLRGDWELARTCSDLTKRPTHVFVSSALGYR